jgi:AraC-like DNA-binding protein
VSRINRLDAFRNITEEDIKNGLVIRWAGHYYRERNSALDRVHNKYYLIYVYLGKGFIRNNRDEVEEVGPGSIVLFKPGERQCLWADADDPFCYYGTCFCGQVIDFLLAGSPLCSTTHHKTTMDRKVVVMMNSYLNLMLLNRDKYDESLVVSKFFGIIAKLNENITRASRPIAKQKPVKSTIEFLEQYLKLNYNKPLTIKDLAKVARYSVTWVEQEFKKKYSISPMQYLARVRIKKAQELLASAEGERFNISEIGYAVGYNDPFYFSKVFKKITKLSPKKYRELYFNESI